MLIPGRPEVQLALPIFCGDTIYTRIVHQPQGGRIAALLTQVHLFAPKMHTLDHIHKKVDNMAAQVWSNRGSIIFEMAVGTTLQDLALLTLTHKICSSVQRISISDNNMADPASRLTHLTKKIFLKHLHSPYRRSLVNCSPFYHANGTDNS